MSDTDGNAPPPTLRLLLVCSDPVTRTLALRMTERLGHPAPIVATCLAEAGASFADCNVLLIDAADVSAGASDQLAAARARPSIIVVTWDGEQAPIHADATLIKPLELSAFAAALDAVSPASADSDLDPAACAELRHLFGRTGLAEMLSALRRDLPLQQQRLEAALLAQDRPAIRRIAHGLRGVALQFGAHRLAALCSAVERCALEPRESGVLDADPARMLARHAALVQDIEDVLHGR